MLHPFNSLPLQLKIPLEDNTTNSIEDSEKWSRQWSKGPQDLKKDTAMSPTGLLYCLSCFPDRLFPPNWNCQQAQTEKAQEKSCFHSQRIRKRMAQQQKIFLAIPALLSQTSTEILPGFLWFQSGQTASWFFHFSSVLTHWKHSGALILLFVGVSVRLNEELTFRLPLSGSSWCSWPPCLLSVSWAEWGADLSLEVDFAPLHQGSIGRSHYQGGSVASWASIPIRQWGLNGAVLHYPPARQ